MPRLNAFTLCILSLALAAQIGRSQTPRTPSSPPAVGATCKIYSLADLGDDANLTKWVADTLPKVIEPASWQASGGSGTITCYAPTKVLVVYHTPAVHKKVDEFLTDMKKASAKAAKPAPIPPMVQQAQFLPAVGAAANPAQAPGAGYPVPPSLDRPKHLFHYVIRYEGEGIIDANVVKFAKALIGAMTKSDSASTSNATASAPMKIVSQAPYIQAAGAPSTPTPSTEAPPAPPFPGATPPSPQPIEERRMPPAEPVHRQ